MHVRHRASRSRPRRRRRSAGRAPSPETSIQGRVPLADYTSGRAAQGYRCNTKQVAHQGTTGGFKVLRYRDSQGHVCAFYDSTLLFPKDVLYNAVEGLGVVVLDMTNPAKPRKVANLTSPAMLSPHESLLVNEKRGLLGARARQPGDQRRHPRPLRRPHQLPQAEAAVLDQRRGARPRERLRAGRPHLLRLEHRRPDPGRDRRRGPGATRSGSSSSSACNYHGLRLSDDGRTMYVANIGLRRAAPGSPVGRPAHPRRLRDPGPQGRPRRSKVLSRLNWPEGSIPQVAEPFTRKGRHYLLEVDEFAELRRRRRADPGSAPVGAARIIDIEDPRRPKVVSHLRLAVHQPGARAATSSSTPAR